MTKRMLIDAAHPEETRVVVINDGQLEEFEFESSTKKQLKGNIYLAKVTRVEPRFRLLSSTTAGSGTGSWRSARSIRTTTRSPGGPAPARRGRAPGRRGRGWQRPRRGSRGGGSEAVATDPEEETAEVFDEQAKRRSRLLRSYKIQEVIKRRQILLVQVVKEERGNKGAALTTYLSLAGRYSVLMPNTPRAAASRARSPTPPIARA